MLGQMNQWDSYRRFYRDIEQVLRDQEELAHQTGEVGRRTLTKELKDLQPHDLADLKCLAERQLDLARRWIGFEQEMDAISRQLQATDPLAAENVAEAAEEARNLTLTAQMHSAAGDLRDNQIGQVSGRHKDIIQGLQKVFDILANRRRYEQAGLVKKYMEAEPALAELHQREEGLRKELEKAAAQTDPLKRKAELQRLAHEQEALQREAEEMARRLERMTAEQAGRTAQQAGRQMGQAGKEATAGAAAARRGRPPRPPRAWKMLAASWPSSVFGRKRNWPWSSSPAWTTP